MIEFRAKEQIPEGTILKIGDLLGVVTLSMSSRVSSGTPSDGVNWEHEHRFTYDGEGTVQAATGCEFKPGQSAWVDPVNMERGIFPLDSTYADSAPDGCALLGFVKEIKKDGVLLDIKGYLMVYRSKSQVVQQ